MSRNSRDVELRDAMQFLRLAREDSDLAAELRALDPDDGLGPVLDLAARAGLAFSVEILQEAHRLDWQLRWAHYSASTPPSAASTVAVVKNPSSST